MTATDPQVRIIMRERSKGKTQEQAAAKANISSRKTVMKYERLGKLPSELKKPRVHRTRRDPFEDDWAETESQLEKAPELEAKILFEWLCEQHPGKYQEGQLRTFQRRVSTWGGAQWEQAPEFGAGTPPRRNAANGWYLDDSAGDHDQRAGVSTPADPQRAALLKLELGTSGANRILTGNSAGSAKHLGEVGACPQNPPNG